MVNSSIVYDKVLGQAESTIECRVSSFCLAGDDEGECAPSGTDVIPSFEMFERIGGDLKSLFRG